MSLLDQFYIVAAAVGFFYVAMGLLMGHLGTHHHDASGGHVGDSHFGHTHNHTIGIHDHSGHISHSTTSTHAVNSTPTPSHPHSSGGGDHHDDSPAISAHTASAAVKSGLMHATQQRRSLLFALLRVFSPTTIAMFLFAFGLTGLCIQHLVPFLGIFSLIPAILAGLIGTSLLLRIMSWLMSKMYSSTNFREEDLVGTTAEVTVSIPAKGTGEITYLVGSVRHTAPARAQNPEQTFPAASAVIVIDINNGIFYVEPWAN